MRLQLPARFTTMRGQVLQQTSHKSLLPQVRVIGVPATGTVQVGYGHVECNGSAQLLLIAMASPTATHLYGLR